MSDYNFLMESRLSPEQYAVLSLLSRLAAEQGLNLYLVGGAVRDLTYGQQIVRDLDFIVEGSPQRILRAIPSVDSQKSGRGARGPVESPLALEYQTLSEHLNSADLLFSNGVRAELAMCREEIYSRPGQRPEVRAATVFEDERALTMPDTLSVDEERWITLGMDALGRILVVVYTWRAESIRLISARPATPRERAEYGSSNET